MENYQIIVVDKKVKYWYPSTHLYNGKKSPIEIVIEIFHKYSDKWDNMSIKCLSNDILITVAIKKLK